MEMQEEKKNNGKSKIQFHKMITVFCHYKALTVKVTDNNNTKGWKMELKYSRTYHCMRNGKPYTLHLTLICQAYIL